MQRVIAYVDGFNLYFGLKEKGWRRFYWLDVAALSRAVLKPDQQLEAVKYFTARISTPIDKAARQQEYLNALACAGSCSMIYGRYQSARVQCPSCKAFRLQSQEKMTDVNIAMHLFSDAVENRFDTALLISGDADLVPVVQTVHSLFPEKKVVCGFPPARGSKHLSAVVSAYFMIGRAKLAASQFPDVVIGADGVSSARRPPRWA